MLRSNSSIFVVAYLINLLASAGLFGLRVASLYFIYIIIIIIILFVCAIQRPETNPCWSKHGHARSYKYTYLEVLGGIVCTQQIICLEECYVYSTCIELVELLVKWCLVEKWRHGACHSIYGNKCAVVWEWAKVMYKIEEVSTSLFSLTSSEEHKLLNV